ncbi:AAA family ATPase [Kineosporia sp. J2-2]|uniref:DNA 3'-5' helicase n=1 Tax=Kineosporia corallincola TaxID=2835133 RepID=A0ABS5TU20_9ACTN|nr:UvrD-helicase domain-containing protein [Kineosporia corallincola]MBT0774292.1 AAA family ATPase [Kineosporia corallincola]
MPHLALTKSCWQNFEQLEKPVRNGVHKAMDKFRELTVPQLHADKGLHLEQVKNAADPRMRTIRITDFWRGVVLAPDPDTKDGQAGTFLLVDVVPHDEAYAKAKKLLFSVNSATLGLEVRDVTVIDQLTKSMEIIETPPAPDRTPPPVLPRLFAGVSDNDMQRLGVDEQVLQAVRLLTEHSQLSTFGPFFPEDQYEVLQLLSLGFSVDEVYQQVIVTRRPSEPVKPGESSLEKAIVSTPNRVRVITSSDELRQALEQPLIAWKTFLHASQRKVAYHPRFNGPVQVSGGPGTGKTVVALHRVKHLLDRYPGHRVLLTTYTNALADSLQENLRLVLDDDAERLERVHVSTVNRMAVAQIRKLKNASPSLLGDEDDRKIWRRIRKDLDLPWSDQFLVQEYRNVVLAQQIRTLDAYQTADRPGRGAGLRRQSAQREQIWGAIERYHAETEAVGTMTHTAACQAAADIAFGHPGIAVQYDHVVVDEAQDLHPAQWRFLRAVAPEGPDDLFITGDPHQRIYDSQTSLSAVGIKVTGRSRRLRINYRSTEEILTWSTGILTGAPISDMSGNGHDSLTGYRSLLHGAPPVVTGHGTEAAEIDALVKQVLTWCDAGMETADIAICSRFRMPLLDKAAKALADAGIKSVKVDSRPGPGVPGVRLATAHAMKGLEFRAVAVLGVTAKSFPFAPGITAADVDQVQHDSDILRDRCLLFVACTRAREALAVSWSGPESSFITPLLRKQ